MNTNDMECSPAERDVAAALHRLVRAATDNGLDAGDWSVHHGNDQGLAWKLVGTGVPSVASFNWIGATPQEARATLDAMRAGIDAAAGVHDD